MAKKEEKKVAKEIELVDKWACNALVERAFSFLHMQFEAEGKEEHFRMYIERISEVRDLDLDMSISLLCTVLDDRGNRDLAKIIFAYTDKDKRIADFLIDAFAIETVMYLSWDDELDGGDFFECKQGINIELALEDDEIPPKAKCIGCMGSVFGDCDDCNKWEVRPYGKSNCNM